MQVTLGPCARVFKWAGISGDAVALRVEWKPSPSPRSSVLWRWMLALLLAWPVIIPAQQAGNDSSLVAPRGAHVPPRVAQAEKFLSRGGRFQPTAPRSAKRPRALAAVSQSATTAVWQPLGPGAVLTPTYGLVTGRISALALDRSDGTGNRL